MGLPRPLPTSFSSRERLGQCKAGGRLERLERKNRKEKERRERVALCYKGRVLDFKYMTQNAVWEGGIKTHYLTQTGSIIQ